MRVTVYSKFSLIPNNEDIIDHIPIFATQEYADYLNETKNYKTIWFDGRDNGNAYYMIPFAVMKKGPFKKGMFLTATNSLGKENTLKNEKIFLNEIIKYIKSHKLCDWIQQPPNWAIFNAYPDGAIYAPFGTYQINLGEKSEDELFKNLSKKNRQYVNKANKEGVKIEKGIKYLDDVLSLIRNTLSKAKMDFITKKVALILKDKLHDHLWVYIAYYNSIPQAGTLFLSNSFSTYGYYAGTIDKPVRGATTLLYWGVIKDSKNRGVKFFDFVGARINPTLGSKQEKLQLYKRHFGTVMREGYLWKYKISKTKYFIYQAITKIRSWIKFKKFQGDIIDQEIRLGNKQQ